MSDEDFTAYDALGAADDDHRWAFDTGFDDPLAGVDTTTPDGVDGAALAEYCLMLGDDALIFSHRLQQWTTRAPELEEETALANIALDLLGQARLLFTRAGRADGSGRDEDAFAFGRDEHEFRNVRLVERVDVDFAELIARQLVFSTWRLALFVGLRASADPVLAAIAAKGVKEMTYHRDYAAGWCVRLGDGTTESSRRMQAGLDAAWEFVPELLTAHPVEGSLDGIAVDSGGLGDEFDSVIAAVLSAAKLERPVTKPLALIGGRGGRDGMHTEAFGYVLAELQSVARAHPGATW